MEVYIQKLKETAELLAKYTEKNVDPDLGITNKLLNDFGNEITSLCVMHASAKNKRFRRDGDIGNIRFKGVFNVDRLPSILRGSSWYDDPFISFIINLGRDEDKFPSGHFVACLIKEKKILYIDSFGLPPPKDNEPLTESLHFLEKFNDRELSYNKTQIQEITSKACGLFALCFILLHELRLDETNAKWYRTQLKKNDTQVKKTLCLLLSKIKVG